MQEIHLIASESTATSLVFRSADDADQQFFLAVDETVRTALRTALEESEAPSDTDAPEAEATAETSITAAAPEETSDAADTSSATESTAPQAKEPRAAREVDPRLSSPLQDSPRQIQERIRAGASIAEVAEANGVTESRIEPYAHPILLERARIAEMAKQAHPVRDDGPARLTLWEVLATAFAARGQDLSEAQWDAFKENPRQWVIVVSWHTGHSTNYAEWSYHATATSTPTVVARNSIAAELIDPQAPMNQRGLSAVPEDLEFKPSRFNQDEDLSRISTANIDEFEDTREDVPVVEDAPERGHHAADAELVGEDFLQHPPKSAGKNAKKKRKAVTPHWEDVLLGVRANTQRPRDGK